MPNNRSTCCGRACWAAEMDGQAPDAGAHFVGKWLQREPEMVFAELFCPVADKPVFRAWGALLHELRESLFELSDPGVSRIKTAWWAEEMIGLGRGMQRHPVSAVLLGRDAPWSPLGRALLAFEHDANRPADSHAAIAALTPVADAVLQVECGLFNASGSPAASRSLAVHWLLYRLPGGLASDDQARIPMHLLARHGLTAEQLPTTRARPLLQDWADELLAATDPRLLGAALYRRTRATFDRARLQRLASSQRLDPLPPPVSLWRAWRAARQG